MSDDYKAKVKAFLAAPGRPNHAAWQELAFELAAAADASSGPLVPSEPTMGKAAMEKALVKAALDLFGYTNSAGFKVPIPNTHPPVYIICGDETALKKLATT